ncbi:hypothetical protein M3P05_10400 [Sansalvadorimonas sp. 2012CJ34-2]|uniref:Uracil-DNA glycosylase-like domain-containing protein n=1 Tax=Parendozoicomonas callyspongiae TaxID=2942213 RepID=A0ABT0PG41_9GAMM|nr:hypothetical protein [Sansalvadorimonas sp. 2012CJ34-2]MCL6270330.1 hypothetical protein [Sansalvadorimonas sp. 2012CJ34-2]
MRGAITERQRQDYLAAIGIQPWFPRFKLPNAQPSQVCNWEWRDEDFPSQPVGEIPPSQPAPRSDLQAGYSPQLHSPAAAKPFSTRSSKPLAPVPKESSDILVDLGEEKGKAAEPAKETTSSTVETPTEITPAEPFRIAAIDINEHCLAVADLPWSGLNQFTGYHERLLRNILLVLGIKPFETQRSGMFSWPITPEASQVDQRFAREALNGYLNNQFGLARRKTVLLFGRSSCHYLWDQSSEFEQCRGYQNRNNTHYALTCSLGEMMSLPDFKADAWQDLAPLKEHLKSQ